MSKDLITYEHLQRFLPGGTATDPPKKKVRVFTSEAEFKNAEQEYNKRLYLYNKQLELENLIAKSVAEKKDYRDQIYKLVHINHQIGVPENKKITANLENGSLVTDNEYKSLNYYDAREGHNTIVPVFMYDRPIPVMYKPRDPLPHIAMKEAGRLPINIAAPELSKIDIQPIKNRYEGMEPLYMDVSDADYEKVPGPLRMDVEQPMEGQRGLRNKVRYGYKGEDGTVYYERGVPGTPGYQGRFSGKVDESKFHFTDELEYGGTLQKFVKGGPKRKSVDAPESNYQTMNNADQRAEYEAGWKAYSQGAEQWVNMLNREEERRGRELTPDEKEKFIEKFVKPEAGQRRFDYDPASDRRFDFLFDDGYTTWNTKENAPVYNYRRPLNITEDRGEYALEMDRFAKEWMGKEDTGFARALGFDAYSDKRSKNRAYDYARTKVAEQILASNPQGDRNRVEWMKTFSPEQLSIIQNSQAGYNMNPDMGTQFRQGMANLFGMDYSDEDLTPEEAKQASRLGALAPLGYTSNFVRGAISGDLGTAVQGRSARPMTYGSMESYVQPGSTQFLEELSLAGMDPLNTVGIGLLDDAGRAGRTGQAINAAGDLADASETSANIAGKLRRFGYNAAKWQPEGESTLANFMRKVKTPAVDEHLYGLGQGLAEIAEGERPFFEIFPMTKAQKERIWAKQDAALKQGEDFVKQWIYGPDGEIRPQVVDRAVALDPATVDRFRLTFDNNSSVMDSNNILNQVPSTMVSSRSKDLIADPRIGTDAKDYIRQSRGKILGANNPNYNITLRNQGFYHVDPTGIANTSAHETGHTFQRFGNSQWQPWSSAITKHDSDVTPYYFANDATPSGKMFEDAMVEPNLWANDPGYQKLRSQIIDLGDEKLAKLKQLNDDVASGKVSSNDHYDFAQQIVNEYDDKIKKVEDIDIPQYKNVNRNRVYTWEASPKELHSELMVARMNAAKRYVDNGQFPNMEAAIQYMQNPGDDVIDYMIADQRLNRFFKGSTDADTKRKLIRMLPAAIPAVGAGMMMDNEETDTEGFAFGGALSKFVGGGQHGGLDRWFAEKWVDVKTGKPCGRQEGEDRNYPACRPSKRVSEDTPKTSSEMSPSEKAKFKRTKTSSERIPYNHKRN